MKKLRVGIMGSGFGLYGLLPAFRALPNCTVISIFGERTERLLTYCKSIGLKRIYTNWQLMLKKEKLDAVAIAVPPKIQYQIAMAAIKKGLHVFAEKPLAANLSEAEEMYSLAKTNKIISTVDFIFPEVEEWRIVKNFLKTKKYGRLEKLTVNWDFLSYDLRNKLKTWKTDVLEGGGAMSFFFSHTLYYLEYFAGNITQMKSKLYYSKNSLNGGDVGADLQLIFKTNIRGFAHLRCNNRKLNRHQLIFVCSRGKMILENNNAVTERFKIRVITKGKQKTLIKHSKNKKTDEDERVEVVERLARRFVNASLKKNQMKPSIKDGLRVQELIDQIRNQN